ncbi:TIGR04255 family protein [Herpetosiphon geysericola]|uniref:TIGR04255 family protein n=1 Tax=Herpetosiphon geysericola TaxID=70996 RepID=UPI001364A619|nr:TIGR04255 family protein [Herpetosiphon geysericola]
MGAQYEKPPIIEVVAEVHFATTSWNETMPERFARRIKGSFTELLPPGDGESDLDTSIWEGRKVFKHYTYHVLVQIGEGVLVVNNIDKYIAWDNLLPVIKEVYTAYKALDKEVKIQHIILRYINQIDIPHQGSQISLEKYFNLYPYFKLPSYEIYVGFIVGLQFPFTGGNIKVEMRTTNSEAPEVTSVILDMECFIGKLKDSTARTASSKFNLAHQQVEKLFEAIINDNTRQLFIETRSEGVSDDLHDNSI